MQVSAVETEPDLFARRDEYFRGLAVYPDTRANSTLFKQLLASWVNGVGVLPEFMGIGEENFHELLDRYFPGAPYSGREQGAGGIEIERQPEREELLTLLMSNRAGHDDCEPWLADIVVAACMGGNHLWQDLGVFSRTELSELMARNFPTLAARNDRDMKWKKFLYKQLCIEEGIYTCRAPSCEVCVDYASCFGPEQ